MTELVRRVVEPMGYELVGVEFNAPLRGGGTLRVYIDQETGVTLDDCEAVSHQLSGLLDVEDPIRGEYSLEVSSPGLDRPLFSRAHFERFSGERAKLKTRVMVDGRRRFTGILRGVVDQELRLEVDGTLVSLPLEQIESARLVPDF